MGSNALWRTKRNPTFICCTKPWPLRCTCSVTATPRSTRAEAASSSASKTSASGAPSALMSMPPSAGPATSGPLEASAFLACASTRRSRGTTWVSTTWAAVPATVCTLPSTKDTR